MHVLYVRRNDVSCPIMIEIEMTYLIVPITVPVLEIFFLCIGERAHMQEKIVAVRGAVIEAGFVCGGSDLYARFERDIEAEIASEHEGAVVIGVVAHIEVGDRRLGRSGFERRM